MLGIPIFLLLRTPLIRTLSVQTGATMRVVNLDTCRNLLQVWSLVRQQLTDGADGFAVCVRKGDEESVFFAGEYERDAEAAAKAAMRMSWRLTKAHDTRKP